MENFGEATDLEVIDRLVSVRGLNLVDVGCGDGALTRALAQRGGRLLGIEPDPVQAEQNRRLPRTAGLTFVEAPAQAVPAATASVDGVFFSRSLHHVPLSDMDKALREAIRVLRLDSGFLYVLEPLMEGSYSRLIQPFHDETEVRRAGARALDLTAAPRFRQSRGVRYVTMAAFPDFAAFVESMAGHTYNRYTREAIETPKVRARFEAGRANGGYRFEQPMRVNFYRGPRSGG